MVGHQRRLTTVVCGQAAVEVLLHGQRRWLIGTIDRWLLGVGDGGLLHERWPAGGMEGGGAGERTAVAVAQAMAAATICGAGTCRWFCCVSAGAWARVAFG
jgi:hypothetical protein